LPANCFSPKSASQAARIEAPNSIAGAHDFQARSINFINAGQLRELAFFPAAPERYVPNCLKRGLGSWPDLRRMEIRVRVARVAFRMA
jgi:hypothetical protein